VFDQLAALEAALAPYEQIKTNLAAARIHYRELTNAFVDELKARCAVMTDDEKRTLVLELFAQDMQVGLDSTAAEKREDLMRFVEGLWDKYRVALTDLARHPRRGGDCRCSCRNESRVQEHHPEHRLPLALYPLSDTQSQAGDGEIGV
jgi:hypothetical protein